MCQGGCAGGDSIFDIEENMSNTVLYVKQSVDEDTFFSERVYMVLYVSRRPSFFLKY